MKKHLSLFALIFILAISFSLASCDKLVFDIVKNNYNYNEGLPAGLTGKKEDPPPVIEENQLAFELNAKEQYYYVVGIGTCTDTEISIPEQYKGLPVKAIGRAAFKDCKDITAIHIPDSIVFIDAYAFAGCNQLSSLTIPKSAMLNPQALNSCPFIKELILGRVQPRFDYHILTNLETLIILDGATDIIDSDTFKYCYSLKNVFIPSTVTKIDTFAFEGCNVLESINVDENNIKYCSVDGVLFSKNGRELILYPYGRKANTYTVDENVTKICEYAFKDCIYLENLILPENDITLESHAFQNCKSLKEMSLPASLVNKSIGAFLFEGCSSLEKIIFEDGCNITYIPEGFAKDCSSLNTVKLPESLDYIAKAAFYKCSSLESIYIPDSVITIGSEAFQGCSSLKSIVLPELISAIYYCTFKDCSDLESVYIPDNVTSISNFAFAGCKSLESITLPIGLNELGAGAFENCMYLDSIVIPEAITVIPSSLFYGCLSLENVEFLGEITEIGNNSFGNCVSLKSIFLPKTLTLIDQYAFRYCRSLESIDIPDSVETVGIYAFTGCSSLKVVKLSASLTKINDYSFENCSSLTDIRIPESVSSIGRGAFKNCTSLEILYLPQNVVEVAYRICEGCPDLTIYLEKEDQFTYCDYSWNYSKYQMKIEVLYGNPYENE